MASRRRLMLEIEAKIVDSNESADQKIYWLFGPGKQIWDRKWKSSPLSLMHPRV